MQRFLRVASLVSAFLVCNAAAVAQGKRPLAVEDLYLLDAPQSLTVAPDGKHAAYVRNWIDAKTKQERNSLWLSTGATSRPLEDGEPDARAPLFSPDGKWIAFLSTRPRPKGWQQVPPAPLYSDAATDIWLMPSTGGAPVPLAGAKKPYGRVFNDGFYGRVTFSPDGKKLAFVADDGRDPATPQEKKAGVVVVRPDQGEGYTGYGPAHIWIAYLDGLERDFVADRIDRLTDDEHWYGDPQWTPDGRTLLVHANRTSEVESVRYSINRNFDIWAIDVATRSLRQLTPGPGPEVSPRVSPDGKRFVCLSVPRKGSHRDVFNLAVGSLDGSMRVLFNHHGSDGDRPPHMIPSFPLPEDCWEDAEHVRYRSAAGTKTVQARVNVKSGQGEPAESHSQQRVFNIPGNAFLKERELGATRVVRWQSTDRLEIEGILTTPPASVAQPPYKLLLYPHGGPHSRSTEGFNFLVEVFAAHGYAVFQPNFRGSEGYGQKFIDADRFDLGGGDMQDILTGIELLVKEKIIDPKRQYVFGSSYGGFMTTWLVGHTNQFRAAAAQNAVTDLNAMWGLSDIQTWTEWEFGGRPWEVADAMRKHSPITYVANVTTPTLVIHARDDRRVPLPMGKMFYQALLSRGIDTQLVIYPNEGHGIRQPRHREDVLRRVLAWFDR